ncbi:MAG: hypothetical protein FWG66_12590 [Spirochaetes bacterium]|nr:hypothetical protein [Spirochaetota bacterium]
MGHCISAFLGYSETIDALGEKWEQKPVRLSGGLSMLFLTDVLFDRLAKEYAGEAGGVNEGFDYLTGAVLAALGESSLGGKLAYFETDYFGGTGTQASIFFENGAQKFPAAVTEDGYGVPPVPTEERALNKVLREFGLSKAEGKIDEWDSAGLGEFRRMPRHMPRHLPYNDDDDHDAQES